MNNQKGFTLIELVVVIVILGILAAVAVPKFVDMQGEAKKGVLEGIRGSWKSAVMMSHAKWLAGGGDDTALDINTDGTDDVDLVNGYPQASPDNLDALVDLDALTTADDTDEFKAETTSGSAGDGSAVMTVTYGNYTFTYTETGDSNTPPNTSVITP
jgi:MSHA pilin protein MshA